MNIELTRDGLKSIDGDFEYKNCFINRINLQITYSFNLLLQIVIQMIKIVID